MADDAATLFPELGDGANVRPMVFFGEVLLRLSPPDRRLLGQASQLDMWVGGAEANVATGLARLDHPTRMVSALPDSALGDSAIQSLKAQGVDTRLIHRRAGRMGLYFATPGAGLRAGEVLYDRAHSSFADTPTDLWDWDAVLDNAQLLHLSGITPALGPGGTRTAIAAAEAAAARGVPISFDGNWRATLWNAWDGAPRPTLRSLVAKARILFGNHRDIGLLFGREFRDDAQGRRAAAEMAFAAFPKLEFIASTIRAVEDSARHRLAARLDTRVGGVQTEALVISDIVDRIGGGDAFATGILHAFADGLPLETVARTGLALAALKHGLPGDASLFTRRDLDLFLAGERDVRR